MIQTRVGVDTIFWFILFYFGATGILQYHFFLFLSLSIFLVIVMFVVCTMTFYIISLRIILVVVVAKKILTTNITGISFLQTKQNNQKKASLIDIENQSINQTYLFCCVQSLLFGKCVCVCVCYITVVVI